jgi:hypothetical protein
MRLLSQAAYNRQLKLVLREVYAHHALKMLRVTYYRYKMGKPHKFTEDKAELISSHSMRRGFCTRHLNSSHFNETDVLKMLGSKDMDELQRYLSIYFKLATLIFSTVSILFLIQVMVSSSW